MKKQKRLKEYELFHNGSIHGTIEAYDIKEARRKVLRAYGEDKFKPVFNRYL